MKRRPATLQQRSNSKQNIKRGPVLGSLSMEGERSAIEATGVRPEVTVLLSLKAPDGTTKFVDQIVTCKPDEETIIFFSWKSAIFARYDVFHVHWPEWLVRDENRLLRWVKYSLMVLLLIRLRMQSTPVVRTLHNLTPHRPGRRVENVLVSLLDNCTQEYITLNPYTPCNKKLTLIPPGDYTRVFARYVRRATKPGRVLFFGRIEPYKNASALVEAFLKMNDPETDLRIVGALEASAFDDGGRELARVVEKSPRISGRFEFVSDEDLVAEITQSELVVLPYREMHNSGALLVALSLGCVVLAPPTVVNRWIQDEVGKDWLILSDDLTPDSLSMALTQARSIDRTAGPVLAGRDWSEVATRHYDVYTSLAKRRHR